MNAPPYLDHCPRCQQAADREDRYCRACGYGLRGRPDYAQELCRSILETVPVGIFVLDLAGRVRHWNRAMEEHGGHKRRDVLGRVLFDLLPYLQPYAHRIMQVADSALPLRLEHVTHENEPGGQLTESFWFGPLLQEDGTAALLGVMEDITQKVRVDNLLIRSERLAAIGELAAGVAHNFNNILAAIGGDAQLLKLTAEEEQLPSHVADAAQQICDEVMRGGRIAHDLLSFARGSEPHMQRLDVSELARDATRLIKNHPSARAVSIELSLPVGLPLIEADSNLLHQVFFNLMLNALQAMPNGGILTISSAVRGDDGDPLGGMLDLKFHDTGVGISREQLRRVFDPFYSQRAGGGSGSGLGLPVSLAMIKSIGGDIQLASAEGIGTTVTVSLPIVERRTSPRASTRRTPQGRVLLVDDDANVRRTLTTLLTRRGYDVATATSGDEALERFAETPDRPFKVVLTELMLPRGGGPAALRRLCAQQPEAAVVVLTGVTDASQLREALECGARFCFSKPPSYTELLAAIDRLVRNESYLNGSTANGNSSGMEA